MRWCRFEALTGRTVAGFNMNSGRGSWHGRCLKFALSLAKNDPGRLRVLFVWDRGWVSTICSQTAAGKLHLRLGLRSSSARKPRGPAAMFAGMPNKRCFASDLGGSLDFLPDIVDHVVGWVTRCLGRRSGTRGRPRAPERWQTRTTSVQVIISARLTRINPDGPQHLTS